MIYHGRNLIVSIDGTAIAAAKTCTIDVQGDTIETSTPMDGRFRTFEPGRITWSVSVGKLVTDDEDTTPLKTYTAMVGQKATVTFGMRDTADTLTGQVIITQWKVTGTLPNLVEGSFGFRGTGPLG